MFKRITCLEIDNKNIVLYKRAGKMYYSLTELGNEIESSTELIPVRENLPLGAFQSSL